jgi:hypothetical protein
LRKAAAIVKNPNQQKKDVSSRAAPVSRRIKTENSLPKIEPLPGAVCIQWKRCGKANCKCSNGMLHGPYYYRFWYAGGTQIANE